MSKNFEIKFDKRALEKMAKEATRNAVFSGEMTYSCPECGKPITLRGLSNVCECGYVLNVRLG